MILGVMTVGDGEGEYETEAGVADAVSLVVSMGFNTSITHCMEPKYPIRAAALDSFIPRFTVRTAFSINCGNVRYSP